MGRADRRVRLRETPTPRAVNGWAAGHDAHTGTMILALAARHRAERPAMGMEGGLITYGAAQPAAVCLAYEKQIVILPCHKLPYSAKKDG